MHQLISIHDVMPHTLDNVYRLFDLVTDESMPPVTLLVVPDTGWTGRQLDRLRELVEAGAELAGHGWRHEVASIRGIRHRVHSALISRNVAEHLALDRDACMQLMRNCHQWFGEHDLPPPDLYVPPAWAMGRPTLNDLEQLPFRRFEIFGGVYVAGSGFTPLPMVGFEADTWLREVACRAWNRYNVYLARRADILRIGIHPSDLELRLADAVESMLQIPGDAVSYSTIN